MSYRERPGHTAGLTIWTAGGEGGWVLPDGCMDVLWNGTTLLVAGPDTRAGFATASPEVRYAAVRFGTAVGPAVLAVPAFELRNQRTRLADVIDVYEVERLELELGCAARPDLVLEAWATRKLLRGAGPDRSMVNVASLLNALIPLREVADIVGLGERQLRRRALASFGYAPKVLARIQRFQRGLSLARAGTPLALAAAEAGYFDQAHFAREVRCLAEQPVTHLLR